MERDDTALSNKLRKLLGPVEESYPDVRINPGKGRIEIVGTIPAIADGMIVDRFQMRIVVEKSYPRILPAVFEIGGRIPRSADRHVNRNTGEACILLKDKWGSLAPRFPTVLSFIKGPVNDFLLWQLCFEEYGEDRLGGWAHGAEGRLEYYKSILETDDIEVVKRFLLHLSEPRYKPNWLCYCGSGQKACKCHKGLILSIRSRIDTKTARSAYADIAVFQKDKEKP